MNIQNMIKRSQLSLLGLLGLSLLASPVAAQVFDSGPSDPSLFDTVVNVPTNPNIGDAQSVGNNGVSTQLNIFNGGSVGSNFSVNSNSEVNISGGGIIGSGLNANSDSEVNLRGGSVGELFAANDGSAVNLDGGLIGRDFEANANSVVNIIRGSLSDFATANSGSEISISGGTVGFGFEALFGSVVNLSGGTVGRNFVARSGSDVELRGGEFLLNGSAFSGSSVSLNSDDTFTGTLADGSSFIFATEADDSLSNVQLTSVALPALDLSPIVVSTAFPNIPSGLRPGQTLNLQAGGELGFNFEVASATLNIEGGTLGTFAAAAHSTVNINRGTIGNFFDALPGSVVNISGGNVAEDFFANSGSVVNISGGHVANSFNALSGSVVNISGGIVAGAFEASSGSEVNISGGTVQTPFFAFTGSNVKVSGGRLGRNFFAVSNDVELIGGDFKLNGVAVDPTPDARFDVRNTGDILTGTFADGSTFIFSFEEDDRLFSVKLTSVALPALDLSIMTAYDQSRPSGLRPGQTLRVFFEGFLGPDFEMVGGTLDVAGGTVGDFSAAVDSTVNVSGGSVGVDFDLFAGSVLNVSGGTVGELLKARSGSEVNISGGFVGDQFKALSGSVVNISGGEVGELFEVNSGGVVNMSGGTIGDGFIASSGSEINLSGSNFALDGNPIDNLALDDTLRIFDRDVILTGRLADGSTFSFDLDPDFFSRGARLTVTQVVAVPPFELGLTHVPLFTFNGNSYLDFFGISVSGAGDVNGDGVPDFVVGSSRGNNNGVGTGSATVFSGSDGSILYTFFGDSRERSLGSSVSGGDVNGDGFSDIIVGGPNASSGGVLGTVRVLSGFDGTVLHDFVGDSASDQFGSSVSSLGDVNGDGFGDLIVGAAFANNNGRRSGSARVFSGADGSVLYNFDGDSASDLLGSTLSGLGDVNGDGFSDFIVGVLNDDENGEDSGSVRVYSGSDGSVLYTFLGDSAGDRLGSSVGGAGDVNGDGVVDLIAGGSNSSGSARVFSGSDGSVLYDLDNGFGGSVRGAGDVNGDGFADLIVGVPGDGDAGACSGSARVFSGVDGSLLYNFRGDCAGDNFGRSVSGVGDVNGDGFDDFVVGATGGGANDGGYARLYVSRAPVPNIILGDVDQNGIVDFADIPAFIAALQTGTFLPQADANQDGEVTFADIPAFIEILTDA